MTPADLAAMLRGVLGDGVAADVSFDQVTVDVPPADWVDVATALRDDPALRLDFFDWLSAYDDRRTAGDGGDPGLAIVVNLWSPSLKHSVRLRTHVPRDNGRLPTLTQVWAGANWHERETFEMFGVGFDGHPNLVPLLLPEGFEGNPLRKDFVLASRVAKAWPGEKEPGESDADLTVAAETAAAPDTTAPEAPRRARRRMLPPGVPEPGQWGPAR